MQYRITLLDPKTGQQRQELWAQAGGLNQAKLKVHFQQSGLVLVSAKPIRNGGAHKGQRRAALSFCQEMKVLLESGLNVVEAIETLALREDQTLVTRVYQQLKNTLHGGKSLSNGMSEFPEVFPGFFLASIQAGEQSGDVVGALGRFILYREKLDDLRSRLISAALYPMIVLGVSALVILFLMGYVIPRFSVVFADMVDQLPLLTQWLLNAGIALANHRTEVFVSLLCVVVLTVLVNRVWNVKAFLQNLILSFSPIQDHVHQYALARLYRTLAMLVEAGVPFVQAMHVAKAVLMQSMHAQYAVALQHIEHGQSIAHCFSNHQLTDRVTERILLAGERSGDIATAFNNMAKFIEQNLTYRIDRLAKILEPVIMLFVGGLIGLIVVLMYSPIFELANAIQ